MDKNELHYRSKVTVKVNNKEITKFFEDYEKGEALKDFLIYYIRPTDVKVEALNFNECLNWEKKSSYKVAMEILEQEEIKKVKFDYTDMGWHLVGKKPRKKDNARYA